MTHLDTSRRRFMVGSAATLGGLSIGFHIPGGEAAAQTAGTPEINAWVVVKPDDTVVIRIARIDMGQGTVTGLAQLVAEELECDWAKVTTEYPTPGQNLARNRVWGNFQTAGSQGIRQSQDYVRKGGAAARMMLVEAAAKQWNVPAAECRVAAGVITHAASGRSTTYGKVADAAGKLEAPKEIPLKDPKTWTIAGKPMPRLDTADKVDGRKVFGADLVLPGMLNAAIKACPVFGGKLKSFDAAAVSGKPGIRKVVAVGDFTKGVRKSADGDETALALPKTLLVELEFEGGSRILVRPSGTEPKTKVYADVLGAPEKPASPLGAREAARLEGQAMADEIAARLRTA
jgi:isoquinoline 1-oxidoreductase beta subunit